MTIGDSDGLEVGDIVLAIGNPFGVGQTVTQGIVSALARTRVGVSDYQFFIQTDAAINPGNSGGALIDMRGNLVGINTAIYSRSGGSNGIGFAIPSNMARLVAESARQGGDSVKRPLARCDAAAGDCRHRGRPSASTGPRAFWSSASLPAGRRKRRASRSAISSSRSTAPPSTARTASATRSSPRAFPARPSSASCGTGARWSPRWPWRRRRRPCPRDERAIDGYSPFAGITVANLSPAVAEEMDLKGLTEGVVIVSVDRRSPAASVGLLPGDVIVDVNGDRIGTSRQLERVAESDPRTWRIVISRNGQLIRMAFRG